jgi:hypothetical protein
MVDVSWVWLFHNYILPAYTYWYYFGPLLLFAIPLIRMLYGSGKYLTKMLLILCSEMVDFLIETTSAPMRTRGRLRGDEEEEEEEDEEVVPISAERLIENVQRMVTKIARYCVLLMILAIPIWFTLSLPFIYYNNYAECQRIHSSHVSNVLECNEKGYSTPAFQELCMRSDRESRKSTVYCSMSATVTDLQVYVWNTLCSPFVITYLLGMVILAIVRSGLKSFSPPPAKYTSSPPSSYENENFVHREHKIKLT